MFEHDMNRKCSSIFIVCKYKPLNRLGQCGITLENTFQNKKRKKWKKRFY